MTALEPAITEAAIREEELYDEMLNRGFIPVFGQPGTYYNMDTNEIETVFTEDRDEGKS